MSNLKSHTDRPPPDRGHPMPRRTTPEESVTLRHHRLAQDAAIRAHPTVVPPKQTLSPRRNSSGESHDTGRSDAKKWYDKANKNPAIALDGRHIDVDPPFFQKETDSSNEDLRLDVPPRLPNQNFAHGNIPPSTMRPTITHSSSADDFRSVIDDLTIENKLLKEELRRYKQFGPDLLKKEKLFEIKFHGLPRRKKRELEATLRNFAASLEGSSEAPSQRKKSSKHANRLYFSGGSNSKHASSSSSQSRPADSAYASASTGPNSSGTSLGRPSMGSRAKSSEQKVEHYLEEIPEGLYPGFLPPAFPDKEKKKLVVKKLEQLFTGRITGRNLHRNQSMPSMEAEGEQGVTVAAPPSLEPLREARIQRNSNGKKNRSRDNLSASNSNGEGTESGGYQAGTGGSGGNRNGTGTNPSPPTAPPPEQRPTRPRDLDPDRVQIPSENMDYIRHLGLVAPELLAGSKAQRQDVSPDADGWVYLNLLSNLAQLHILNVSPDFIRKAVSEKSTKFQLSPDGRKIRWRGGSDGTKFSSDSSGDNSQRSPTTDEDDGSDKNGQRKRRKTEPSGDGSASGPSGNKHSKFEPQTSGSGSFHYKPLFIHRSSSIETSLDETGSQYSYQVEDSNFGNSRWDYSGSGSSPRKRRRADGAITFYSGAPFCTDLSGDPGDVSPTTYMTSAGQTGEEAGDEMRPSQAPRTLSGSSIPFRPLLEGRKAAGDNMDVDSTSIPDLATDDDDTDESSQIDSEFPWCDEPDIVQLMPIEPPLEPSGVGRVYPEDHFTVVVTTRRPCFVHDEGAAKSRPTADRISSGETTDSIAGRLASMTASSPTPTGHVKTATPMVHITYLSGRIRRLKPVPLPPPAMFYPLFSTSSESDGDSMMDSEEEDEQEDILASSADEILSKRANPQHSDNAYPDGDDSSSEDDDFIQRGRLAVPRPMRSASGGSQSKVGTGSSVATAGGAESGYISSAEDS